ncbi:MAG: hypothetical protein ACXVRP_01990 [Solirubrobacteraceae bacterium]
MPINETTYGVTVAAPSRLRTELNVVAAAVAVGISLVILALIANTPATRAHRHLRPAVVHPLARP